MNLLRFRQAAAMVTALFLISAAFAQEPGGDKVDLDALAQIKTEAFQHSQVMENLFWMSEVYGPRVTNSRNHKLAAEWAMKQMKEWGLKNVHLEKWPFGYGWQIKKFLRRDGDSGLCCVYRVPAGMDAWDERPDHGRAGVGAHPLESRFRQIPWQAEGQGAADV